MKKFLSLLCVAISVVGCNKDVNKVDLKRELQTSISIINPKDITPHSRVDVKDDGADGYTVQWNPNDQLSGWVAGVNELSTFTIDKFDADKSLFKGDINAAAKDIYFVHPSIDHIEQDGTFTVDLSSQRAESDLSHLASNTYMVSGVVNVDDIDQAKVSPKMKQLGSIIDLNIICEAASAYELTRVEVACETLPTEAIIDLTKGVDDDYFSATATGGIVIDVPNFRSDDNGHFPAVSFNILPFTFENGAELTFTATFYDKVSGDYIIGERNVINSADAAHFARATRNTITSTIAELSSSFTIDCNNIKGSTNGSVNTTDLEDFTLSVCNIYSKNFLGKSYMISKVGGYMYNNEPLSGVSKIVVAYSNSTHVSIYEASEAGVATNEVVGVQGSDPSIVTYTFPAGAQYFVIKNESSSPSNINSINLQVKMAQ